MNSIDEIEKYICPYCDQGLILMIKQHSDYSFSYECYECGNCGESVCTIEQMSKLLQKIGEAQI